MTDNDKRYADGVAKLVIQDWIFRKMDIRAFLSSRCRIGDAMEKTGVISVDNTPPEDAVKLAEEGDAYLEEHVSKRLSEGAENAIRSLN